MESKDIQGGFLCLILISGMIIISIFEIQVEN